jgi:aspartate 1-decarboxylase
LSTAVEWVLKTAMQRTVLYAKIHRATVTAADLEYVGSLTLDEDLMDAAGIVENEQVHVVSVTTGARLVTYVIRGERGTGTVCLNGAAARLGAPGDVIIVIAYATVDEREFQTHVPRVVYVN